MTSTPRRLVEWSRAARKADLKITQPDVFLPIFSDVRLDLGFFWETKEPVHDGEGHFFYLKNLTDEDLEDRRRAADAMLPLVDVLLIIPTYWTSRGYPPQLLTYEWMHGKTDLRERVMSELISHFSAKILQTIDEMEESSVPTPLSDGSGRRKPMSHLPGEVLSEFVEQWLIGQPIDASDLTFLVNNRGHNREEWKSKSGPAQQAQVEWPFIRGIADATNRRGAEALGTLYHKPTTRKLLFLESLLIDLLTSKNKTTIVVQ